MIAWPARVHADFNDLTADGTMFVLQRHAEPGRTIANGELVLLQDGDGNSMYGHVTEAGEATATVGVIAGSWWDCGNGSALG